MRKGLAVKNILLPEFIMYCLNTFVFFIGTIIYSVFIRSEDGLITILNAFLNDESPYWAFGVIFIYILIAIIIYIASIFLAKNIFSKILVQIKDYIISSFLNLGSSLSGIMFATTIFVFRSSNNEINSLGNDYILLSIFCFVLFFVGVGGSKFLIFNNKNL